MYKDWQHEEMVKGVKFWQNPKNKFHILMLHYTADPEKDPERDGAEWYEKERRGTPKADWLKEREIDFTTRAGKQIYGSEYCDYDPNIHVIDSFELDGTGEIIMAMDFGQRNPTCALIGYWTTDNKLFIIDEYRKPALPSVSSRDMFDQFEYLIGDMEGMSIRQKRIAADNAIQLKVIDPTTRAKNRSKTQYGEEIPYSVIEEFYDHGWDFEPGQNDVASGITRVREYMQIQGDGTPNLYIFGDKCPDLVWELSRYRYKEHAEGQERKKNASEEPVKKDDHSCLTGDSLVNTTNGDIPIKDLVGKTGHVYSYDEKKKRITAKPYKNVMKTGTKETIRLVLDDGSVLKCTKDHPILLRGGDYIDAGDIKPGDSLMPLHKKEGKFNHKVVSIEAGTVEDVYNMEVEDTHNFACEGVIVHNCDALRYMVMTRPHTAALPEKAQTRIQKDINSLMGPKNLEHLFDID